MNPAACPDRSELWDLLDGSLPQGTEIEMRRHLEACSECRAFLNSARRLEGALRAPEPRGAEPEFDTEFRTRLLQRLATSGEERRLRVARRWPRAGVAAAVVLVAIALGVTTWSGRSGDAALEGAARARRDARLERNRDEARLALLDTLHDFQAARPGARVLVDGLDRRFASLDLRLDREILRVAEAAKAPLLRGVVAFMGEHRAPAYASTLRVLLAKAPSGSLEAEEIEEDALNALARIGSPESLHALAEIARHADSAPLRRRLAVEALARRASARADALLREILEARGARTGSGVIAILIDRGDASATLMLRNLYLAGHQSEILEKQLSAVPETARWIRRRLLGGDVSREQARRLIRLAGRVADAETMPALMVWIEREEEAVLAALVALDTPGALDTVASRLVLGSAGGSAEERGLRHARAARALSRAAPGRAAYFLRRAREAQGRRGRRFVLAAGFCGDAAILDALEALTARPDRESEAVEAIALIGGAEGEAILDRLARGADSGIRRSVARVRAARDLRAGRDLPLGR